MSNEYPSRSDRNATRVVRVWRGQGTPDGVTRYCEEHFPERVLPQLRGIDGFLEARVLVRTGEDSAEVVVITTWDSLEAVKAFAGNNYELAVVEPAVSELLERFDDEVTHYTIAHDAR